MLGEVEHVVKVSDIADENRIRKENLMSYLPPRNQKFILAVPPRFDGGISTWRYLKLRFITFLRLITLRDYWGSPEPMRWNGLGIDRIAVPNNVPIAVGDILKVRISIQKVGHDPNTKK
jgi:hypothetical protein